MNAAALRSDRVRRWVATNNEQFFETFGAAFADALGIDVDDPRRLGLIAQSLYVGLMTHRAFDGGTDAAFAEAYRLLSELASE